MRSHSIIVGSCRCGGVQFSAEGKPIAGVVCYCADCQEGARKIEALPEAPPVHDPDGGTAYLLYRKDRFSCIRGGQYLADIRIRDHSPTRRVVASCCNSALFLDFEKGHWLPAYRARFGGDASPVEMRVQTRFKPQNATLPRDVPSYPALPLKLVAKLISARIGMQLHS